MDRKAKKSETRQIVAKPKRCNRDMWLSPHSNLSTHHLTDLELAELESWATARMFLLDLVVALAGLSREAQAMDFVGMVRLAKEVRSALEALDSFELC